MAQVKIVDKSIGRPFYMDFESIEEAQKHIASMDWSNESKFEWFDSQGFFSFEDYFSKIHHYYTFELVS
jgi:hypothetical protein